MLRQAAGARSPAANLPFHAILRQTGYSFTHEDSFD